MSRKRRKRRPRRPAPPKPPATEGARSKAAAARPPRKPAGEERPPAPWGSFPLVELTVLVALVMLVAGFVVQGQRGAVLLGTGLVLGSLAGLELSVREHFAGFRSHTLLLAAAAAVATLAALFYAFPDLLSPGVNVAVAVGVFALVAWALTRAFQRRSGRAFKIR